jgi:FixJ family two-component response regulator
MPIETVERAGKVLVVDDEAGARAALQQILATSYEVEAVDDGEAAIDHLRRRPADVVTLDLRMPGLSGLDTFEGIREVRPETEVVVVTGVGSFESAVRSLRLRAFDFLAKPFDAGQVLDVVARACRSRTLAAGNGTRKGPHELAAEIANRLSDLEASPRWPVVGEDRLRLDHARLIASAIRDRIDPDPTRRWPALRKILETLAAGTNAGERDLLGRTLALAAAGEALARAGRDDRRTPPLPS